MNCPLCANEMIKTKATAYGEDYDYCRTCKKELKELTVKIPKDGICEIDSAIIPITYSRGFRYVDGSENAFFMV